MARAFLFAKLESIEIADLGDNNTILCAVFGLFIVPGNLYHAALEKSISNLKFERLILGDGYCHQRSPIVALITL